MAEVQLEGMDVAVLQVYILEKPSCGVGKAQGRGNGTWPRRLGRTMTADQQKSFALLFKPDELTDAELREMRSLINVDPRDHIQGMAMIRASLDNIAAIRKFKGPVRNWLERPTNLRRKLSGSLMSC